MHQLDPPPAPPLGTLGKSTNEGNSLQLAIGEMHCLFQFCIERFQSIRRLFLQHSNSRAGGARRIVEGRRWPSAYVAARQPKRRTVGRAGAYHILWVRGYRDHTIPGRGFNLFKPLRRHFRATPFCRHARSRRDPGDQNASVPKIDDRLGGLLREGGRGASESSRKFAVWAEPVGNGGPP
jgi:hypothetical protein